MDGIQEAWLVRLAKRLGERRAANLHRELRNNFSGATPEITLDDGAGGASAFVQFCTNNYLGLATDPEVIAAARDATEKFGTGSGSSRLVAGSLALHHDLENALARFKGAEAALVFPTGFMANLAVLTTFAGAGDLIVSDKLNHASLLDAARYSGALCRTFPHRNLVRAEAAFGTARGWGREPGTRWGSATALSGDRFHLFDGRRCGGFARRLRGGRTSWCSGNC